MSADLCTARLARRAFVGRDHDLRELKDAMDTAAAGHGLLVLVGGEPGIGKTHLADELAAYAASSGARALWGGCGKTDGAPAFWPWIQLLRAHVRDRDQAALAAELGHDAAEVARLVPEVAERVAKMPTPPALDPEPARFRLFDSVVTCFKQAAAAQPLLLILDDLHWSDRPSLLLLRFLARELRDARLLVVGTYRDVELTRTHPLAQLLGELTSEHQRILLRGLSEAEVAQLITLVTSEQPDQGLVAAIQQATDGNPLFVREVVRLLASQGRLRHADRLELRALGVPHGVRDVLERRLRQLSPLCAELLSAAAVMGHEFCIDLVAPLAGLTRERQIQLLEEATAARLVDELPGAVVRYRFAHTLVREVCYEQLRPLQRVRLHRLAGLAIEQRCREQIEGHLAELAYHFGKAAGTGDAAKAVEYASRAGQHALDLLAYEEAASHSTDALQLLQATEPTAAVKRCELLLDLGTAQMAASQLPAARATYEQAAALAKSMGAGELLARAALGLGVEFTSGIIDDLEVHLLEEALEALGDIDSALRARVLARLAKALLFTPLLERRRMLSEQAVAMARRIGDPVTLAAVLYEWHVAIWGSAKPAERLDIATEVVRLAERSGDRALALQGRALRMGNLLELGDMPALDAEIETYDRMTAALRQLHYRWHVPLLRATQATLAGRFEEAERLAEEGRALGQRVHHQGATVFFPLALGMIRFAQGRYDELEGLLREQVGRYPALPGWRASLAYALAEAGRKEEARVEFERLAVDDFAGLPRDFTWVSNLAFHALTCTALGDTRAAAKLYELLLPHEVSTVRLSRIGIGSAGPVAHYLGLLAATTARWDDAARHFEAAMAMNARIGAAPFMANSRYQYAHVLLARGRPDDHERAHEHLAHAVTTARALGIRLQLQPQHSGLAANAPGDPQAEPPETLGSKAVREGVFFKEGEYWTIAYRAGPFRLKDMLGLTYLARLLARPGHELHALDLVTWASGRTDSSARGEPARMSLSARGEAILDPQAKAAYRRRLTELASELEEAERWGDQERVARAKLEIDALTEQLAQAVGLGGRDRRAATDAERARVSVTKAVKAAIRRIAAHDAELGDHLARSVRTGAFVAYAPDPAVSISWRL
ncbi:MAG: ATP-binding protein [Egibacteraceae bacterium]